MTSPAENAATVRRAAAMWATMAAKHGAGSPEEREAAKAFYAALAALTGRPTVLSPAENAATVREALDRLFPKRLTEAAYPALDALLAKAEADENYAGYGEILEELTQRAETAEARLEHTQDALRQIISTPSADNAIADLMRDIARAALPGEGTDA